MRTVVGIFLILHGLVHLLYIGQSLRFLELESGMIWPDASWVFSRYLGVDTLRTFTAILCVLVAAGFIIIGVGLFFDVRWWRSFMVASAVLSTLVFVLTWNGHWQKLDDQGGYSVLINVAILAGTFF